jgi:N utilization substance protein B
MKTRRSAREWALKVLYARELSGEDIADIIENLQTDSDQEEDDQALFAEELVYKTDEQSEFFDRIIKDHVEKWELDRIAVLDRIILRIAICELYLFPDIPPKVTLNEAIVIARKYSTEKSDKFVNGVLDAVLRDIRRDEPPGVSPEEVPEKSD